eukprot:jgi/Mesvir1/18627/Mv17136-RA.1
MTAAWRARTNSRRRGRGHRMRADEVGVGSADAEGDAADGLEDLLQRQGVLDSVVDKMDPLSQKAYGSTSRWNDAKVKAKAYNAASRATRASADAALKGHERYAALRKDWDEKSEALDRLDELVDAGIPVGSMRMEVAEEADRRAYRKASAANDEYEALGAAVTRNMQKMGRASAVLGAARRRVGLEGDRWTPAASRIPVWDDIANVPGVLDNIAGHLENDRARVKFGLIDKAANFAANKAIYRDMSAKVRKTKKEKGQNSQWVQAEAERLQDEEEERRETGVPFDDAFNNRWRDIAQLQNRYGRGLERNVRKARTVGRNLAKSRERVELAKIARLPAVPRRAK